MGTVVSFLVHLFLLSDGVKSLFRTFVVNWHLFLNSTGALSNPSSPVLLDPDRPHPTNRSTSEPLSPSAKSHIARLNADIHPNSHDVLPPVYDFVLQPAIDEEKVVKFSAEWGLWLLGDRRVGVDLLTRCMEIRTGTVLWIEWKSMVGGRRGSR